LNNRNLIISGPLAVAAAMNPAMAQRPAESETAVVEFPSGAAVVSRSTGNLDAAQPTPQKLMRLAPGDAVELSVAPAGDTIGKTVYVHVVATLVTESKKCLGKKITRQPWVVKRSFDVGANIGKQIKFNIQPTGGTREVIPLAPGEKHQLRLAGLADVHVEAGFPSADVVFQRRDLNGSERAKYVESVITELQNHPNVRERPRLIEAYVLPGNVGSKVQAKVTATRQ